VNILDGDECKRKINLLPKVEHGQIFIGSLFEWNEKYERKEVLSSVSLYLAFACMGGKGIGGEKISLLFGAFGA